MKHPDHSELSFKLGSPCAIERAAERFAPDRRPLEVVVADAIAINEELIRRMARVAGVTDKEIWIRTVDQQFALKAFQLTFDIPLPRSVVK